MTDPAAAPAADGYSVHRGYSAPVVNLFASRTAEREGAFFLAHLRPGMRVLDVGCGPGTITVGLARAVAPAEAVGIDLDQSQVTAARAHAAERGITNLRFATGRGEALAFPDGSFDAVFSHAVIEHVPDPLAILREMRRVVRPGGLAGVDASDWGGRVTEPPIPGLEEALGLYVRLWEHNGGHARLGRQLPRLMHAAGFGQVQTTPAPQAAPPGLGELFAGIFSAPRFVEQVTALGWADREAIARWVAAFRAWDQEPDGCWAHLRFQAVGRAG